MNPTQIEFSLNRAGSRRQIPVGRRNKAFATPRNLPVVLLVALATMLVALGAFAAEREWTPLFNGRDLSGWMNVNCAPKTFTVRDGMIISTGVPTGVLRTDRQYENFELELDYRHMKEGGNAGLFVWSDAITSPGVPFARAIEVQILDGRSTDSYTSHGDVFAIHGATFNPMRPHPSGWMRCLPSERRAKPAGEWNHYHVTCSNGIIRLAVNGREVSGGSGSKPRKGYICLESEGSECHFRNLRIREWPSTNPTPDEVAPLAQGFQPLYTGIDLSGWRMEPGHVGHWRTNDWTLAYDGESTSTNKFLPTEKEFGDFVLVADWRLTRKPVRKELPVIRPDGNFLKDANGKPMLGSPNMDAGNSGIYLRGQQQAQAVIWCWSVGSGGIPGYFMDTNQPTAIRTAATSLAKRDKPAGEWNRFEITLRGDRVTVVLNGKAVIENAQLPGIAKRGPIGLGNHGDPIEFANIFIKEL